MSSTTNALLNDFATLLEATGDSSINIAAYDTAWVARVSADGDDAVSAFPQALTWLEHQQHSDGSWGEGGSCERIIATLAALIALKEKGHRANDASQIEQGLRFIWHSILHLQNTATLPVGFELLLGALIEEGRHLGLSFPNWLATHYEPYRQQKLGLLQQVPTAQLRNTSAIFSLEFMGSQLLAAPESFVYSQGSVGFSPAATASVLRYVTEPETRQKMLGYLSATYQASSVGGGWGNFTHFDLFESIWVLYNLHLCGQPHHPILQDLFAKRLNHIGRGWTKSGLPMTAEFVSDGDITTLGFSVLAKYDEIYDPAVLESYWRGTHLATYRFERDHSNSANIHGLEAFRSLGETAKVSQLLSFLDDTRNKMPFWIDKWHSSPYYATSHAIIASAELDANYLEEAMEWIRCTQNQNGSWGSEQATAEETAYAIQAIVHYAQARHWTEKLCGAAKRGLAYLRQSYQPFILDAPSLWISKNRYTPRLIVRSAILSALILGEEHGL